MVIKKDIATAVQKAIELAGVKSPQVLALRYPLRQWRAEYVQDLAGFVREVFAVVATAPT